MKKIAIACDDDRGLNGQVSAHFGRCPFYVIAEVENDRLVNHRVEKNPHWGQHSPGVMPRYIHSLGANVILAGGMGPRAVDMFESFGIDVATGVSGIVNSVLDAYLKGEVKGIVPCQHDHPESCGAHQAGETSQGSSCQHHQTAEGAEQPNSRVAIPVTQQTGLASVMDPRFGRAPYFVIVDLASEQVLEIVANTAAEEAHGAGISAAKLVKDHGAEAVVAGRFGPKAMQALEGFGITLWVTSEELTVSQVMKKLKTGALPSANGVAR